MLTSIIAILVLGGPTCGICGLNHSALENPNASKDLKREQLYNVLKTSAKKSHTKAAKEAIKNNFNHELELLWKESRWNSLSKSSSSTAFGLAQFLDRTWINYGVTKTNCATRQIDAYWRYIDGRYGTSRKALRFHRRKGYY